MNLSTFCFLSMILVLSVGRNREIDVYFEQFNKYIFWQECQVGKVDSRNYSIKRDVLYGLLVSVDQVIFLADLLIASFIVT